MTRACACLGISRRRLSYRATKKDDELVTTLEALAQQHSRFGARQLRRKLLLSGERVNLKRVRRLCRLNGLTLKPRRKKKRLGIGAGMPCQAERPNHVWAYDFMEDRTETNRKLRILTVVDEFTRRCIEVEVEHRMNAKFVARTLMKLFAIHGTPTFIRSDNGPEFIAKFLMNVMKIHGVQARHIDPGSPWQNGKNERFNGTLRDECLNLETFHHRDHARAIVKLFKRTFNEQRPHSSLGEAVTPQMFYEKWKRENQEQKEQKDGCAGGGEIGLSHCAFSGRAGIEGIEKGSGPTALKHDRPDDHRTIHVGAPVAPQQSRILRVDEISVTETTTAGTFPASALQTDLKT